jgi:DNA-binding NarL/FixJ family response regulator
MRALLADDHPLYLEAARIRLERLYPGIEVVEANTLPQALDQIGGDQPLDFVLLDFSMPGMNGPDGVRRAVGLVGSAPVAVMSGVADRREVTACIAAGAKGFLPKTLDANIFAAAVNMILLGGTYIPAEFAGEAASAGPPDGAANGGDSMSGKALSSRELQVLTMLTEGLANKEIARRLDIEEVTIKLHMTRIFKKLGVRNRAQAAVRALESGLLRR